MTTHIYRVYDPQARRLRAIRPTSIGGTTEDDSSTILHFTYTPSDYLDTHTPYIIFNVKNSQGEYMYYYPGSDPSFDGRTFALPYALVHNAGANYLKYVLAFSTSGIELDHIEFEQSELDTLQIPHSFTDAVMIRTGIPTELPQTVGANEWIEYIKQNAVFNPVEYDDVNTELTFTSFNGTASVVSLKKTKPQFATLLVGITDWYQKENDEHWYHDINVPGFFSEDKTVTMYWNEATEHYASIVGLTLVGLNGTSAIIRADTNPGDVWNAGQTVLLDFMTEYASDLTQTINDRSDGE
jgi:hypothetical protein